MSRRHVAVTALGLSVLESRLMFSGCRCLIREHNVIVYTGDVPITFSLTQLPGVGTCIMRLPADW